MATDAQVCLGLTHTLQLAALPESKCGAKYLLWRQNRTESKTVHAGRTGSGWPMRACKLMSHDTSLPARCRPRLFAKWAAWHSRGVEPKRQAFPSPIGIGVGL